MRPFHLVVAVLVVAVALAIAGKWLMARWTHVYIDDARIGGDLITVSSEVNGRIASVAVIAGDIVEQGAPLVRIERAQAGLDVQVLEAQAAVLRAQRGQLAAQQDMIRAQVVSRLEAAGAQMTAAAAAHEASKASLEKARSQFARISALAGRDVMSRQSFEDAQASLRLARQQELATAAGIELARANRAVVQADEAQIAVLGHQIAGLDAQLAGVAAQLDQKRIDLAKRDIDAAVPGVVDATFVDPGEYVSPGTRLLIYHDPRSVWVDANVKETDFRRLRIGARATVSVDAYPDLKLEGRIVRLGHAATSQFALLPSPNPSGNFTKVTQRLPVRIAVEQKDRLLRPGMMVEVSVDVVD
ncbi:MAG: HlyD family secretion protein [Alphaproteobacteria bacterium]|nr:HlyD family secretion protein [Alphaproteobacteria bacterium]